MARSESPDTRLLLSLVRRRLALLSIYSAAQRLRDREQTVVPQKTVVVRSKFVLICGQLLTRKTEISVCGIGVLSAGFVCEGSIKANFHRYRHYLKSRFGNIVFRQWFGLPISERISPAGYAVEWNSSKVTKQAVKPRTFHIESDGIYGNGYLYLSYMRI